jgi:hypothetical protein
MCPGSQNPGGSRAYALLAVSEKSLPRLDDVLASPLLRGDESHLDVAGKVFEIGAESPYRHGPSWSSEQTTEYERLVIGGGDRPVELLVSLARELEQPLFVLAVLRVPRTTDQPGKLESEALDYAGVVAFYREFEPLFARDGRVQGWIGATDGSGLLVLDEHDVVYAYGPLGAFEERLRALGYEPGVVEVPTPHEHHYSEAFDDLERKLVALPWRRVLPLEPDA